MSSLDYLRSQGLLDVLWTDAKASPNSVTNIEVGAFHQVDPHLTEAFLPEPDDLARLHKFVIERKVTTVLEFGVGHSTVVIADALRRNERLYDTDIKANLRRSNPFQLHSVDADPHWIEVTSNRLPDRLKLTLSGEPAVFLYQSRVLTGAFQGRICTYFESLPNICPDFVYLDAPSQFASEGDVRGISTTHADRLPMSADLLAIEHFLLPGTLIVIDGRSGNARFLRCNFQRNWHYVHYEDADFHTFELRERPLGKWNRRQIEFCLGASWLDGL